MSFLATNLYVLWKARPHFYDEAVAPDRTWMIVPGALVRGGRPSDVLRARLEPAAALWLAGRVQRVLVSGRAEGSYDEPDVMRSFLVDQGVPADRVFTDGDGLRTFLTARNASRAFDVRDAIVCTNAFHLARSVYLLRALGVDAVGVPARRRDYAASLRAKWELREVAARGRAVWDVAQDRRRGRPGPPRSPAAP